MKSMMAQLLRHLLFIVSRFKQLTAFISLLKGFEQYYRRVHHYIRGSNKLKGVRKLRSAVFAVIVGNRIFRQHKKRVERLATAPQLNYIKDRVLQRLLRQSLVNEDSPITNADI